MRHYKIIYDGHIVAVGVGGGNIEITGEEYDNLLSIIRAAPKAPNGYTYKLHADAMGWELVELPPVEEEPPTTEESLTRYANTLTGANDTDIISAAETLIINKIKED